MTIISCAQNFEDVILWRALKHVERGFYIDIGAQDPVIDSVSLAFYEQGWRGVHVEPTAYYADKLRSARPDEEVLEAAIGAQEGAIAFFEIAHTGLSTGDEATAQKHEADGHIVKRNDVPCLPLSKILDTHKDRDIHWLKIDVEGMEGQVIESWAPSAVRPWIVLIESTKPNSPEPSFAAWEPQLVALGYKFVYFDGLNRFYVSVEHPELKASFGAGPNVFDGFVLSGLSNAPFCDKLNTETTALRQQLSERTAETAQLSQNLEAVRAQAAAQGAAFAQAAGAWERASTALAGEIALKNEALAGREAEIARLNQRIAEMDARGQAAMAHETALKQQLAAREAEVASVNQRIAEMDARSQGAMTHEAAFKDQIGVLEQQLAAVYRSTSWRVTMPMRATANLLRRRPRGDGVIAAPPSRSSPDPLMGQVGKTVVLLATYPLVAPRHGGQVRCAQIVKMLRDCGLQVITISAVDIGAYSTDPLGSHDICFPTDSPYRFFRGEYVPYANDYLSGQYAAGDDGVYKRILASIPGKVDIIFLEQPWMLPVANRLRKDRNINFMVYGSQNDETALKRSIFAHRPSEATSILLEKIRDLEISACREADLVFAVNESDRTTLSHYSGKEVLLAPNGVEPWKAPEIDYARWKSTVDEDVSRFAVYIASAHPPNFSNFFDVFNHSLGFLPPDQAVFIAGGASGPIAEILAGQRYEELNRSRLRFLGQLHESDLAAIKQLAHAFVLPIVEGSGSNLKTAEALFSETWVVGTPVAFRGFEMFTDLPTVIVASPGREFQQAVKHAMGRPKPTLNEGAKRRLSEITWKSALSPIVKSITSERGGTQQDEPFW